jgi:hypothetical protein
MKNLFTFLLLVLTLACQLEAHGQTLDQIIENKNGQLKNRSFPAPTRKQALPKPTTQNSRPTNEKPATRQATTKTSGSARLAAVSSETLTYSGQIVTYTVPAGVTSLTIEARGAEGGNDSNSQNQPGKGAIITGSVGVSPGEQLKVLVGQQFSSTNGNGGGGGSFITRLDNTPLVIAGGGGGSGKGADDNIQKQGQAGNSGGSGSNGGGTGGAAGNGGAVGPSHNLFVAAGGGLSTNGAYYGNGGEASNQGGRAFINGGAGGSYPEYPRLNGGFGGGGGGGGATSGGGGGGYSGGGAGSSSLSIGGVGGGGGSYNADPNGTNTAGANSGNGVVIISYSACESFTATLNPNGQLTCANKTVTLNAGGGLDGATYQYSGGATNNGNTAMVMGDGPYSVTVTNPGGCSSVATTTVISNTTAPTVTLTQSGTLTCNKFEVILRANTTGEGRNTYSFSAGALQQGNFDPAVNSATVSNPGVYNVTVTSPGGCTATASTTVNGDFQAPQNVTLSNNGPLTCSQTSVTLTASSTTPGVGYSFPGLASSGGIATVNQARQYSVLAIGPNGCISGATTTVESNTAAPAVNLTNGGSISCANKTVTLTASGAGTYVFSASATATGPNTATVSLGGTYTVTGTNTTNGCSATATTQVTSNTTAPNATLTNNGPLMVNQPTVTLTAGGGTTYQFSAGATQQGGPSGSTATVTTPGTYQVTVTSSSNGCSAIASTVVTGGNSASACRNGSGVITVVASGTPVKYEWYRNNINSARLTENPAQVRGTSTASLTLVNQQVTADYYVRVTDANGSAVVYGPFRFTVNLGCNIYARQGAEEVELKISLLGNPVQGEQLRATISGAAGKVLNVQLLDLQGRSVRQQAWQQAETNQSVEWNLSGQASGVYLLQATTPEQQQSVKVVKQ